MALKLGMLGMFHTHADGLVGQIAQHGDEFELVATWEPEADIAAQKSAAWRKLLPELRVLPSAESVLGEALDGVVVEGRVHHNLGYARQALEAGYPVLLEKPAGHKMAEFRQLIELARRKNLHVQMLYLFRYMAGVQEMLRRVAAGDLGQIYLFRARLPKTPDTYERFVEELKHYRGGMFFEMAGHVIDMMVKVCGAPQQVKSLLAHHHTKPPEEYVDNAVAIFQMQQALGVIEVPAIEVAMETRRVEVYGSRGALVIPHLGSGHLENKLVQPVDVYSESGGWQRHNLEAGDLQIADLREFADVIHGRKSPEFTMDHDLAVQEALLRASGMI